MTKHSSECSEDIESLVLDDVESESPGSVVEPTQPITSQEKRKLMQVIQGKQRSLESLVLWISQPVVNKRIK